jgi:HK97 gp10 family phage protein
MAGSGLHFFGPSGAKCIMQLNSLTDIGETMPLPAAQYVAKRAREYAHVITGYMRSRIHARKHSQLTAVAEAGAPYSGYEEYGTRFRPAHPFMRPAIADAQAELPKLTARQVNAEIRRRISRA